MGPTEEESNDGMRATTRAGGREQCMRSLELCTSMYAIRSSMSMEV